MDNIYAADENLSSDILVEIVLGVNLVASLLVGQTGLPSFYHWKYKERFLMMILVGLLGPLLVGVQPPVLVLIREPELPKSTTDLVQRVPLVVLMRLVVLLLAAEVQLPRCQLGHLAN